jgi:hypothetical protein
MESGLTEICPAPHSHDYAVKLPEILAQVAGRHNNEMQANAGRRRGRVLGWHKANFCEGRFWTKLWAFP